MDNNDAQAQDVQGWDRRDTLVALGLLLAMVAGILAAVSWQVMA